MYNFSHIKFSIRRIIPDSDDDDDDDNDEDNGEDDYDDAYSYGFEPDLPPAISNTSVLRHANSNTFEFNKEEKSKLLNIIMKNRIIQNYYKLSNEQKSWINVFLHYSKELPDNIIHEIYNMNNTSFKMYQVPQIIFIITSICVMKSKHINMQMPCYLIAFIRIIALMVVDVFYPIISITEKNIINNLIHTSINLLGIDLSVATTEDEEYQRDNCCGNSLFFSKNKNNKKNIKSNMS